MKRPRPATSAKTCSSASTPLKFTCPRCATGAKTFRCWRRTFLSRNRARYRKQVTGFSPAAMQQMMQYPWPGNVRELEHTVERAVLLCRGEEIEPANLAIAASRARRTSFENMSIDEVEALLIRKVLRRCDGNISQAAEALGLSRAALYRRIEKYGIYEQSSSAQAAALGGSPGVALLPGAGAAGAGRWRAILLYRSHDRPRAGAAADRLLPAALSCCWSAAALIEGLIRPLQTLSNVVSSLREGDYSFRARGASAPDARGRACRQKSTRSPICCRSSACARSRLRRCWRAFLR